MQNPSNGGYYPSVLKPRKPSTENSNPLSGAGLLCNSNASASPQNRTTLPGQRKTFKLSDASGHEVDLDRLRKPCAAPYLTSFSPALDKDARQKVGPETGEARLKRMEEEARRKEKEEEMKKCEAKEAEDRNQREDAEKARAITEANVEARKTKSVPLDIESKREDAASLTTTNAPMSAFERLKQRLLSAPLELSSTRKSIDQPPSALATARHIQNVYQIKYPEGIMSPEPQLNANAKDGKFRYDRNFLLQFMPICKEKPDNLADLEAIGLIPTDYTPRGRRNGRGRPTSSTTTSQASIGLGLGVLNSKMGPSLRMGNFSFGRHGKLTGEDRFMPSTSLGGRLGSLSLEEGSPSTMARTPRQDVPGASGKKRIRSGRGNRSHKNFHAQATTGTPIELSHRTRTNADLGLELGLGSPT